MVNIKGGLPIMTATAIASAVSSLFGSNDAILLGRGNRTSIADPSIIRCSTLELKQTDIDRTAVESCFAIGKVVFPHALEAVVEAEG